jgi:HEAT repeat protein
MSKSKSKPGDDLIEVIVQLLEHPRAERRAAAAVVLAELHPEGEEVLESLRKAVKRTDDATLRRHAAEAIGAIAPKSIVHDLQPLLKDPDRGVRETVSKVLASGKGVKAEDIAKMLDGSDDKERIAAINVLGAMGGRDAQKKLLSKLNGASSRVQGALIDALRPGLLQAQGEDAQRALEDVEAIIDDKTLVADPDFAVAAIQLLSYVQDEATADVLLRIASSKASPEVRGTAIDAVRKVIKGRKVDQRIYKFLLECVENLEEEPGVSGPAIDTLSNLEVPLALEPRVRTLATSESAPARRWAIRALGELDTVPAARALAKVVETGDPADREAALEATKKTPSGRSELARLLGRTQDEARARQMAATLRSLGEDLDQAARKVLEDSVVEAQTETAEIIVELLKQVGGKSANKVQENLADKAMRLKKKGQYADAIAILRSICHGQSVDPEARFQLGVCELKSSKKVVSRGPNADPCLATFTALTKARDFSVVDRLREEELLEPEDLYYLGFSYAEGNDAEQALGGDILSLLVEKAPDSKLGRMAKNKLKSIGWEE